MSHQLFISDAKQFDPILPSSFEGQKVHSSDGEVALLRMPTERLSKGLTDRIFRFGTTCRGMPLVGSAVQFFPRDMQKRIEEASRRGLSLERLKLLELWWDATQPPSLPITSNFPFLSRAESPLAEPLSLPNGGNTCYLAALTQAFLAWDKNILESIKIAAKHCSDPRVQCGLEMLSNYFEGYQQRRPLDVTQFRDSLSILLNRDDLTRQQDPQEIMTLLVDAISDNMPESHRQCFLPQSKLYTFEALASHFPPGVQLDPNDPQVINEEEGIRLAGAPQSIGGSILVPLRSQRENYLYEQLSGNIVERSREVLLEGTTFPLALNQFMFEDKSSILERDRVREIDDCQFLCKTVRTCFDTAPKTFSIAFKRFTNRGEKIEGTILDVKERLYLSNEFFLDGKGAKYRLDGVIFHKGESITVGHYTAFRRIVDDQGKHHFFEANDAQIDSIPREKFQSELGNAYMLFFTRIE